MYTTKNDLPAMTRADVIVILNARLADSIDLMHQAKQAHWNVKGPSFMALHTLFDEVVDAAEAYHIWICSRSGSSNSAAQRRGRFRWRPHARAWKPIRSR